MTRITSGEITYALGYARVSSAKQAVEGESLDLQAGRIQRAIDASGYRVFPEEGVLQEPFTGTTDDRPAYRRAIALIKSNPGKVRYFFISTLDRFSREGAYRYKQMKMELASLGVQLRDIGGVVQPPANSLEHLGFTYSWSVWSPSDVGEMAIAESNNQERSRILTRLMEAEIKLTQDGYHLGLANDGYVSRRVFVDLKKKVALFPDPERAHFFRTMFAMRKEGNLSDVEIVRHINGMGFRTKPHRRWNGEKTAVVAEIPGKPLSVKHFQCLIQNPIYCGVVIRKWTHDLPIRARGGEYLVSISDFNAANRGKVLIEEQRDGSLRVLYDQTPTRIVKKRHRFSRRWPFKSVTACPICRRPLWASASRGRSGKHFAAYHCSRRHARFAIPQSVLDKSFVSLLDLLRFEPRHFDAFRIILEDEFEQARSMWANERDQRESRAAELRLRQKHLASAFADASSTSIRQLLEMQVAELDHTIAELEGEAPAFDTTDRELADFLASARQLLEHPREIVENIETFEEQRTVFDLLFAALPTPAEIASGTPKLRPTVALVRQLVQLKSASVDHPILNWNTLGSEIIRWRNAAWAIASISNRLKSGSSSILKPARDDRGDNVPPALAA